MPPLRLGVVGVGHLGKEHARILSGLPDVELVGVADTHTVQAQAVAQRCNTRAYADHRALLPLVDAAVVVVPTTFHHAVAADFLRRGIPVLVEKPLALDAAQADDLVELGCRHGALIQVGHIERFNPAFEALQQRTLRPKYVTCERVGGYTGRSTDIGAVLDLMIHDLDLLLALVQAPVRHVEALGVSVLGGPEDLATARLVFENGCIAHLTASRVAPAPARQMTVWAPEGFARVDFAKRQLALVQPTAALSQHRSRQRPFDAATLATLKNDLLGRHLQTLELNCNDGDQLTHELQEFVHSVRTGERPRAGGKEGRDAVALAGHILECIHRHEWDGRADGPKGLDGFPAPLTPLFDPPEEQAAA